MPGVVHFSDAGQQVDWTVREHCTWSKEFAPFDQATGEALVVDSYTITGEITRSPISDTVLKTFTAIKDGTTFRIMIDESDADLAPGTYWWSLQWNDGANDRPIAYGRFVVREWSL